MEKTEEEKAEAVLNYVLLGIFGTILLIPVSLILIFYIGYYFGLHNKGASHYYFKAMKEGDGKEAVRWAKKLCKIAETRRDNYTHDLIGYALELNGEYDEALKVYENCSVSQYPLHCGFNTTRVKYKLGRKKETFLDYCRYAEDCLVKYSESLKNKGSNDRHMALCYIRYGVTMEHDRFMRLSPFLEYKDFLNFMEEEYVKLGQPPEYAVAMELFRAIDKEILNKSYLPDSDAETDAMREKILAERKEKGVKW